MMASRLLVTLQELHFGPVKLQVSHGPQLILSNAVDWLIGLRNAICKEDQSALSRDLQFILNSARSHKAR